MNMSKYPYELIDEVHDLAWGDADRKCIVYHTGKANRLSKHYKGMTNKQIAEKMGLTDSKLHYILYKTKPSWWLKG